MRLARLRISAGAFALALTVLAASAGAEVVQEGNLRVSFEGGIDPKVLPRQGEAPVAVNLTGDIASTDGSAPPQLRTISIAINRHGRLNHHGLPACKYHQIQPASTREAMRACRRSIVGEGEFRANVVLPEQSPFPSRGRVVAFNGVLHGRHVVFAHIFGTQPLPQSQVLAFELGRTGGGYRTTLTAELPRVAADWGFVSSVGLTLQRRFEYRGRIRSYLSAGCPAPGSFTAVAFPFARASFGFEDGRVLTSTLVRTCRVESR
ncbi:MAG TPA: hypothetical protein VD741_08290 [Solirubrobacterales bacterium]|nr:hypothetical protein [Solirubrobacterales bacterium]